MQKDLLIVLIKNPALGKVKSRLARDLGEEMAFRIYRKLVEKTFREVRGLSVDIWILFSDFKEDGIIPDDMKAVTGTQKGKDLGERMLHAFTDGFKAGFGHICLIGGDCYEITALMIREAFRKLHNYDFVLGPANDGGYYLVGMNRLLESIFLNKKWGGSSVLKNTLTDIAKSTSTCFLLKELIDVDTIKDLELLNINPENFIQNEP